jgi:hypothetical protein
MPVEYLDVIVRGRVGGSNLMRFLLLTLTDIARFPLGDAGAERDERHLGVFCDGRPVKAPTICYPALATIACVRSTQRKKRALTLP